MLREPMRRLAPISLLSLSALLSITAGCAGSGDAPTTTSSSETTSATVDPALAGLLLDPHDLPAGFSTSTQVDDTVTTFCAAEDAAAGLRATGRAVRGFTNTASGASVIQLAFRFQGNGAHRFVTQAADALDRCQGVPDLNGLAFEYDALTPDLAALLDEAGSAVGRHGVNVGSGSLAINVVVLQQGDIGELVAVLGVDLPRRELDALAHTAISAAVSKL